MWTWQELSPYHVYAFLAMPIVLAPSNWKNWYTITINVLCLLLSFIPRELYRKFHLSRPNVNLANHIIACITYLFDIVCLIVLCVNLMNFLPHNSLAEVVLSSKFSIVFTLLCNIVFLTLTLCIIAMSLTKLVLMHYTFWFTALNQKQLAVWVNLTLIAISITINLTGYRLETGDYTDPSFYKLFLDIWGVKPNQKVKYGINYPELIFVMPIATLLHIISVSLEWKMNVYDALNNRIHDINIVSQENDRNQVSINLEEENSDVANSLPTNSGQDIRGSRDRKMNQEEDTLPPIVVQEQVAIIDIHDDKGPNTQDLEFVINSSDGRMNREDIVVREQVASINDHGKEEFTDKKKRIFSEFPQKSSHKNVFFIEVQEKKAIDKEHTKNYPSCISDFEGVAGDHTKEGSAVTDTGAATFLKKNRVLAVSGVERVQTPPIVTGVSQVPADQDLVPVIPGVPADQDLAPVIPEVPADQERDQVLPSVPAVPNVLEAANGQYRKLKAFWKFLSKGFSIGLCCSLEVTLYWIYLQNIENEKITSYTKYITWLDFRLCVILLFPYLILSYPEPKMHAKRTIVDLARTLCSWTLVPSSVAAFVLSRLPD